MPKQVEWTVVALIGITWVGTSILGVASAQSPTGRHMLSAGPAYTSKDGRNGPLFPALNLVVRLTDNAGAPQQFRAADFGLSSGDTELGSGKSVRTFADTGYGVKAILVLDASGSMKGSPLNAIHSSITKFVNQARYQDRVEVLTIADDSRIEVPFGTEKLALGERVQKVESRGLQTRLYDGLLDALAQFDSTPPERRQLIVISDGHDEGSRHSIDDVIRQARAENVSIDSIGLTRSHPEFLQTLVSISQQTGGSYAQAKSPQQLDGLIDHGIQAMRATPVVAFDVSKLASDGKAHTLNLNWKPEHLTTSVEVQMPLTARTAQRTDFYRMPAVWVLAGCFVVGSILLFIARRRSQRKPTESLIQSPPTIEPGPLPEPQVICRSGNTVREGEVSAEQKRSHEPTFVEDEVQTRPRERAKTRMVAFFDSAQGQGVSLEAAAGPMVGKSFPVAGDFKIGAVEGNQLTIPGDPTLSSFHARILLAESVLMIEDLQSTNGTFVNGARLGPDRRLLKRDDEIRMGRSVFRVRVG